VYSSLGHFQLAIELIEMIFEKIDLYDAMMLGLTHDTLMVIGWKHIRELLLQTIAPWAGGRIICVGDYGDDLPEGVISDSEQQELRELAGLDSESDDSESNSSESNNFESDHSESNNSESNHSESNDSESNNSESNNPESNDSESNDSKSDEPETGNQAAQFNLYHIAGSTFRSAGRGFELDYERIWGLSSKERQVVYQITEQQEGYHWEKGWVLMNLSKKEYVKSKTASSILPKMKATDARCFGQFVLSRVCWSSEDTSIIDSSQGPLNRGVWAGDRFKIVTAAVFETRTSSEWKDVSVEVTVWLKKVLCDEDGNNDEVSAELMDDNDRS